MNDKPLPKISFDHRELIEKLNKPFFIFGRGDNPLKHVPPIKLDQSKNNPQEDMLAFNWPYIELARMHMEAIKEAAVMEESMTEVKESRKPKIRERVWVTDCDGEVWIMYYNDCDCYFNEFGDVFADDIIAWQPIIEPSPYKGE